MRDRREQCSLSDTVLMLTSLKAIDTQWN